MKWTLVVTGAFISILDIDIPLLLFSQSAKCKFCKITNWNYSLFLRNGLPNVNHLKMPLDGISVEITLHIVDRRNNHGYF